MPYPDLTRRVEIAPETMAVFATVGSATLTALMRKRGLRNVFMAGVLPLNPERKMVGRAFTLRYLPAREDMDGSQGLDDLTNPQRQGVDSIGPGEVFTIEARGNTNAGSLGEILATRIFARGGAGIVTDGAFRDTPGIKAIGKPVFARGMHGAANTSVHFAAAIQVPIGCGGVMVCPGDVLVGDGDGVVVIPQAMAADVAAEADGYEDFEEYLRTLVENGASIRGVYPPNDETRANYAAWKAQQGK